MTRKSRSFVLPARFELSVLLAGTAVALFACSDKGGTDGTMDGLTTAPTASGTVTSTGSATTTMAPATTSAPTTSATPTPSVPAMPMTTASATVTATVSMTATSSAPTTTMTATATASETAAPDDSGMAGAGGMNTAPMLSASSTDMGSAGTGGMSEMNTGGGAGTGGTGSGDPDADVMITAEDFTCIADWEKVLGFRITNIMGKTDEAVAVAQMGTGKYPVGTIIQHLPTEAMVKHKEGFSPETMDWEFFLLTINSGSTVISTQGTTEIMTMGNTCASCHSEATPEYDFVLNTYQDAGNMLAFDFGDAMLEMQIANDPRCE